MGCLGLLLGGVVGASNKAALKNELKGKNSDQQQIIHYFLDERGCLKKGIPDSEFDANKKRQINALNLKQRALNKLGIDEDQVKEIEPICLEGPFYKESRKRCGADNLNRYSAYQITYIFCSSDQVYVYQYTLNLDKDDKKERAEEYFYKDITNFTTVDESENYDFEVTKGCMKATELRRIPVNTNSLKIVVPGDAFMCSMISSDETEGQIQALKAKLREKKNS
ncbi:MAG: hypothetical protein IJ530_16050 [Treponema sp.]|uniref:hypothetical protein n=1 Tax=Treponema sp. TaxID=166 RepID=UPI0025EEEDB5|nr:hypothetical protein [Treponema sp.]MBQ8678762.1 hypothetical protein [Treponema sp.]MBQ8681246.1 hypothetical protein [Treponema sp.]